MKAPKNFKLTRKQERDLREVIEYWKETWEVERDFPSDCPLCRKYLNCDVDEFTYTNAYSNRCKRCPVYAYTGKQDCEGTPDGKSYASFWNRVRSTIAFGNQILKAAGKEPVV